MLTRVLRFGLVGLLTVGLCAVETEKWRQETAEDFAKGKREHVALRSDGVLTLAPALKERLDASSPSIWALAQDGSGALYTAAPAAEGGKLKIYRIPASGEAQSIAEVEGLAAFSLAVDRQNRVYVGVSPEARIYRIEDGKATLFFAPDADYIWAMAFDSKGNLFAATGDKGVIYKVTPAGQGSVFFETEETHVRALLIDGQDALYAGTAPGALVMRITPDGKGFVVYQAEKEEITALAKDKDGNVYAAAVGNKRPITAPRPAVPVPAPQPSPAATGNAAGVQAQGTGPRPAAGTPPAAPRPVLTGGSEVLRIGADGYPRTMWQSDREIVYALALDADGKLLVGTGNEAGLYRVDDAKTSTSLLNAQADQITSLLPLKQGGVAFTTANIGKVFQAGPELAESGSFESDVFDSGLFARWGRVTVQGEGAAEGLRVKVRSGNVNRPQKNWSDWTAPVSAGEDQTVEVPGSRYLQWRAELARGGGAGPRLDSVAVAYQEKNVPPRIVALEATPPNHAFPPRVLSISPSNKITLTPLSSKSAPMATPITPSGAALSMNYQKGHVGVRWLAEDENRDELVYKLEIRPAGGSNWLMLAEDLDDPQYSWDSTSWPDGRYEVRVTVSDRKSNVPSEALSSSEVSEPFTVDNTVPRIEQLAANWVGGVLTVTWTAVDERSHVKRGEYSLNGKDWMRVEPPQGLSDARSLRYALTITPAPEPGTVVAVRVRDEFDNEAVASVLVPAR